MEMTAQVLKLGLNIGLPEPIPWIRPASDRSHQ